MIENEDTRASSDDDVVIIRTPSRPLRLVIEQHQLEAIGDRLIELERFYGHSESEVARGELSMLHWLIDLLGIEVFP